MGVEAENESPKLRMVLHEGHKNCDEVFDGSCLNLRFEEPKEMSYKVMTPRIAKDKPKENNKAILFSSH